MPIRAPSHDEFFKWILQSLARARELIRAWMPEPLREDLDGAEFRPAPTHVVDDALRERIADMAFLAEVEDERGRLRHALALFEHKSERDARLHAQLREYAAMFSLHYEREHPDMPPPALILLVPYHGASEWNPPQLASARDPKSAPWDAYAVLVHVPFRLFDMPRMAAAEFPQGDDALRGLLMAQALIARVPKGFREMEGEFAAVFRLLPSGGAEERVTLHYVSGQVAECDRPELVGVLESALAQAGPKGREGNVRSVFDSLVAEGMAEGMAEGEAKGEAKGKAKGKAELIERQLSRRFGTLTEAHRAQVRAATLEQLDAWADEVLDAESVEDVLQNGDGRRGGSGRE